MRLLVVLFTMVSLASAQFGFFDQMFNNGGQRGQQEPQNNPSDASHYRQRYAASVCDKYLCPDTLACVHFPHHCPCSWDDHEDKVELGQRRLCVSKGGFKEGESLRKIELARKGLL